ASHNRKSLEYHVVSTERERCLRLAEANCPLVLVEMQMYKERYWPNKAINTDQQYRYATLLAGYGRRSVA
ncbi:MAG: hypothetical protein AAF591_16370, partial [Verrucomicrobiota bacterium]